MVTTWYTQAQWHALRCMAANGWRLVEVRGNTLYIARGEQRGYIARCNDGTATIELW